MTAGGTKEAIDDVRYITNFSTGELGHALATQYARLGKSVLLLAPDEVVQRFGIPEGTRHRPFASAESLRRELAAIWSADIVFHAAAVSDYTPQTVEGKISSDEDELVLRLKRTPKILPNLRSYFGEETTLVGFKLLSNVPETELIAVAQDQVENAQTDFCIANLLQDTGPQRRVHIVSAEGKLETIDGDVIDVAQKIASCEAINRRLRE